MKTTVKKGKSVKVLFYTANGVGLGHLRRTSLIAKAIQEIEPRAQIRFVTMSQNPGFLSELKIPFNLIQPITDEMLDINNYDAFVRAKKNNELALSRVLRDFQPQVIVVDIHCFSNYSFPQAAFTGKNKAIRKILVFRQGDRQSFENIVKNEGGALTDKRNVLLPDIPDRFLTREEFQGLAKLKLFKMILLPHNRLEIVGKISAQVMNIIDSDKRFKVIGPIVGKLNRGVLGSCRNKYRIMPEEFLMTVILGGGGELLKGKCESPIGLVTALLDELPALKKVIPKLRMVLVTGPLFKYKNAVVKMAMKYGCFIQVVGYEENLLELMHLSQLVISPVGYNAGNEILKSGTPVLLAPLVRGDQNEQEERAKHLESLGIGLVLSRPWKKNISGSIRKCLKYYDVMKNNFSKLPRYKAGNRKAAALIVNAIK